MSTTVSTTVSTPSILPLARRHRGWLMLSALVVGVLMVRLFWGMMAEAQVKAHLEEVRQRGHPVAAEDLVFADVANGANAWLAQLNAKKAIVAGVDSPRTSNLEYTGYPPYSDAWMKLAAGSEGAHLPVFTQLRQARRLQGVQLHDGLKSPLAAVLLPYLNDMKHMANLTSDGAIYQHLQGNDDEAMERLLDVMHVARSLRHDYPLVSQLVGSGIELLACDSAMIIGPGMRLDTRFDTRSGGAVRDRTRQLIARLLDEGELVWAMQRAMAFERVLAIDDARNSSSGYWVLRPLADREIVRGSPKMEVAYRAAAARHWPEAKGMLDEVAWEPSPTSGWMFGTAVTMRTTPRYSRWFGELSRDMTAVVERQFRLVGERRVTATALACQLYRADHGRFPGRLEELVPTYLPAVPLDPYHGDGRTIGYVALRHKKTGADRPMLYFDAGDTSRPAPDEPTYGWYTEGRIGGARTVVRQYRDITRFVP